MARGPSKPTHLKLVTGNPGKRPLMGPNRLQNRVFRGLQSTFPSPQGPPGSVLRPLWTPRAGCQRPNRPTAGVVSIGALSTRRWAPARARLSPMAGRARVDRARRSSLPPQTVLPGGRPASSRRVSTGRARSAPEACGGAVPCPAPSGIAVQPARRPPLDCPAAAVRGRGWGAAAVAAAPLARGARGAGRPPSDTHFPGSNPPHQARVPYLQRREPLQPG
jgi:hypothetical protein